MGLPEYELFAVRYARRDARRHEHFIGGDPHDAPMPMDYFVWVAMSPQQTVIIDTGFTAPVAAQRKREYLRTPVDGLKLLGIAPDQVRDVVITHLHYDHVGGFGDYPAARFHLQEREMQFATGKYVRHKQFRRSWEVEDICGMVRLNFAGKVELHQGTVEVAPGITLHHVGGHTDGLQIARVHTKRGWVVVASDSSHYYENMETDRPFTTAFHIGDMLQAYRTLRELAPTPQHIIPGHDPLVMRRYPAPSSKLQDIVVRLDVAPQDG